MDGEKEDPASATSVPDLTEALIVTVGVFTVAVGWAVSRPDRAMGRDDR